MNDHFIEAAIREIEEPAFCMTKQCLAAHLVKRVDGRPVVARVEANDEEAEFAIVYFPIEDEAFYLAVAVAQNHKPAWVSFRPGIRAYFRATSEELTFDELASIAHIKPTSGWNKGDPMPISEPSYEKLYRFSALEINPFPEEAYALEHKMRLMLNELEKDKKGVRELAAATEAYISIALYAHVDFVGGISFDRDLIKRLYYLGLNMDMDIYTSGSRLT